MKIPGKGDIADIQAARERATRELLQQQEAGRAQGVQDASQLTKRLKAQTDGATITGGDRVDVSLAKAISTELSPESISAERRKKIEDLKAQIAAGTYNPSSEAIARSVGEEILLEIFSAGPSARLSE